MYSTYADVPREEEARWLWQHEPTFVGGLDQGLLRMLRVPQGLCRTRMLVRDHVSTFACALTDAPHAHMFCRRSRL